MKIKEGYLLRKVGNDWVVLPMDSQLEFSNMMTLNETGSVLWTALEKGADYAELTAALTAEYDVDAERAEASARKFVDKLKELGLLE